MKKTLFVMLTALFVIGLSAVAAAVDEGPGTCTGTNCPGNPDCPDADGDGICNGQDPDYEPGTCNPDCPDADGDGICNGQDPDYQPGTRHPNPICPDADGDGICNGQDPDYVRGSGFGDRFGRAFRAMLGNLGV